jgi:hypothetical protein
MPQTQGRGVCGEEAEAKVAWEEDVFTPETA